MVKKRYIPKQGDIVYLDFDPTIGHEQAGYRPAVVLSHNIFNEHTGMIFVCPITSNTKEFPTHYLLEDCQKIKGSVLCEHMRSVDYDARYIKYVESLSNNDLISVLTLMNACIEE